MMDSGGFLFRNKDSMVVSPERILELYRDGRPYIGVVLDHPIGASVDSTEERQRQRKTLENTRRMTHQAGHDSVKVIPVVHGSSVKSVDWFVSRLKALGDFDTVGIGSLMPSMYNVNGARGLRETVHSSVCPRSAA